MNNNWSLLFIGIIAIMAIAFVSNSFAESVPSWIKQTAKWYSDGIVSEGEFLNAIKYLIENNIIILETKESASEQLTESTDQTVTTLLDEVGLVTKPRLNKCILLNTYYKSLGEDKFRTTFSHVDYINSCIKLYKDPIWRYKGEDRVDKLYEKFLEIRDQFKKTKAKLTTEPTVMITSTVKIGMEKYQVDFNVCAGDLAIDKAKVLIKSEIESVQYGTTKNIPENVCRSYSTQINAKHVANIQIDILEDIEIKEAK